MALETATYIGDLVATNPPASDPIAQASNHLQLIKSVLQNTFPKVDSAITATAENLTNGTPVGLIAMWSGATVPTGWTLCNGVAVARMDGTGNITPPDLRARFIVGSGSTYTMGATGGVATQTAVAAHTHPASDSGHGHAGSDSGHGHVLNDNHSHGIPVSGGGGGIGFSEPGSFNGNYVQTGTRAGGISVAAGNANIVIGTGNANITVGSTGTAGGVENRPPYFALAFIMKV